MCLVAQSCLTLCNPMDCSLPGSSVHGDSPGKNTGLGCHALLLGSSQSRNWTQASCIAGRFFTIWATRGAQIWIYSQINTLNFTLLNYNIFFCNWPLSLMWCVWMFFNQLVRLCHHFSWLCNILQSIQIINHFAGPPVMNIWVVFLVHASGFTYTFISFYLF